MGQSDSKETLKHQKNAKLNMNDGKNNFKIVESKQVSGMSNRPITFSSSKEDRVNFTQNQNLLLLNTNVQIERETNCAPVQPNENQSCISSPDQKHVNKSVFSCTTQTKTIGNQHVLFSKCPSKEEKNNDKSFLSFKIEPQENKDDIQPVIFPVKKAEESRGDRKSFNSLTTEQKFNRNETQAVPSIQPQEQANTFYTNQPLGKGYGEKPLTFPTRQPQPDKKQSPLVFTIEPEIQKIDNISTPFSVPQPQKEDYTSPFLTSQQNYKNNVIFPMSYPKVVSPSTSKQTVNFSISEAPRREFGNQQAALLTGQPLVKVPNFPTQPQKPMEIMEQVVLNQPQNDIPVANKPIIKNHPVERKVIPSGNPFFKSTGGLQTDINELSDVDNSLIIAREQAENVDCLPMIGEDTALNPRPKNWSTSEFRKSQDNLAAETVKSKKSLELSANKDEVVKKTLKQFEKIAKTLTCSNDKIQHQQEVFKTESTNYQVKERNNHYVLHDCTVRMKSISDKDKDSVTIRALQMEILTHLKEMALFTSVLKTSPIINSDIYSVCETINENLSLARENYERKNVHKHIDTSFTSKLVASKSYGSQVPTYSLEKSNKHDYALFNHDSTNVFGDHFKIQRDNSAESIIARKEMKEITSEINENKATSIPLSRFMALLDQLPNDLIEEKENIFLDNTQLFCRICSVKIAFALKNLTEHLMGKNHQSYSLLTKESKTGVEIPSNEPTSPGFTPRKLSNACLPSLESPPLVSISNLKNHKGVLDLIVKSINESFNINVKVYICLLCDYLENDNNKALNHVMTKHKDQQNADWIFCKTCLIHMYGTESHFQQHCLTVQHIEIEKSRNIAVQEDVSRECQPLDTTSVTAESDRTSVCSSKSDLSNQSSSRLNLHENNSGKLEEAKHGNLVIEEPDNVNLLNVNGSDPLESNVSNSCDKSDQKNTELKIPDDLSSLNESGPHYNFMKKILRKHLEKKPDNEYYGLFCNFCQKYFLGQENWESHINSYSHKAILNSSEIEGKRIQFYCSNCNVNLICDDKFHRLHMESLAHKAISRIPGKRQDLNEPESEEDSEDENNSSENDDSEAHQGKNYNRKGNSNDSNKVEKTSKSLIPVKNGIYCTGIPKDFDSKDVAEFFKYFGPIKSCSYDRLRGTACVVFKNKITATIILEKKTVHIKRMPVKVQPLMSKLPESHKQERYQHVLHPDIARTLSSVDSVMAVVSELLEGMNHNYSSNQHKGNEIKHDLAAMVPNSKVHFFGSQVTGLATARSDFDIYIDHDGKSFYQDLGYIQHMQKDIMQHIVYLLTQKGSKFDVKEAIFEARVPIIKVVHKKTRTMCDISCRSGLSVENSQLVRLYLDFDPRVRWLVVLVKHWMEANGLLGPTAFTSYATVWLVLFFLMHMKNPVICPVLTLQKDCRPNFVAKWDCRFHRDKKDVYFRSSNRQSHLQLLAQFFQFYAQCPVKDFVLCPLNGMILARSQFATRRLPREFSIYVDKIRYSKEAEKLRIQTPICLQDPFDHAHNITKGVNRTDLMKFQSLCSQSFKMSSKWLTR